MSDTEIKDKITTIATEILMLSKDDLSMTMPFLTIAFHKLSLASIPDLYGMATDGVRFFFDPSFVLSSYKTEMDTPKRTYLHSVIHCLLQHPFRTKGKKEELWDLCTDIATESVILEMDLPVSTVLNDKHKEIRLADFKKTLGFITAEKLYAYFVAVKLKDEDFASIEKLFKVDKHRFWMRDMKIEKETFRSENALPDSFQEIALEWESIVSMSRNRLLSSDANPSESIYALLEELPPEERKKKSYSEFLKRFIATDEEMKISPDEFDYGLYTHGLNLYRNIPLIEPLEYRESEKIKEFVIAIDTSGSCQGRPVKEFLNSTYGIMKNTERFFEKINFYILQADDRIRSVTHITCDEDFDYYMENQKLSGFGDTDFRPVFRYVDQLIVEGSLRNLKGLVYFTDGFGVFPEWAPKYDSVFVFLKENNNAKEIPAWAIKVEFD